ncbi:MAG: hypothetical protein GX325_09395 [Peptococcaceae bacterium]|nr:hypothetical protein [Peptococcaceae bacterium]
MQHTSQAKKIVDRYVHEITVYPHKVDVILKLDVNEKGADKGGVGGGT